MLDKRKNPSAPRNPRRFSDERRQEIADRLCQPDLVNLSVTQAIYALLDKGEYLCSESTAYRITKELNLNANRCPCKKPRKGGFRPTTYEAMAPNDVWTWDITYFRNKQYSDKFFYAAVVVDVYSRRIMNAKVYEADNQKNAVDFLSESFSMYNIVPGKLVLHSDNGASMKAASTMKLLKDRGVEFSHSRPRVSNDNPYSESLFRTLKYSGHYIYPREGFDSLEKAQAWLDKFVRYYNEEQRHRGIKMVTPQQRYDGQDKEILKRRKQTVEKARAMNPERWIQGITLDCTPAGSVYLNPENKASKQELMAV